MNIMEFLKNIKWQEIAASGFRILIILVLAWVLSKILKKVLAGFKLRLLEKGRLAGNNPDESVKRIETVTRLIRQVVLTAMWCIVSLIILKEIGVEIAPILAGAGILGLAVGFGAQNLVKDIISGFFFILEDQVRVGDIAVVNGQAGQVEAINIRTILLRDLAGVVHLFPHGSITTVSNMTKDWSAYVFDIGVAYKEDTDRVVNIIAQVGEDMKNEEAYKKIMLAVPEIFGVDKFADSAVIIKGRIRTRPNQQFLIGREFLRRLKYAFFANNIEIPFPQRTIYFAESAKPPALTDAKR